jgi:hypothetical protein
MACAARGSLMKASATSACWRRSVDSADEAARATNASIELTGCSRHAMAAAGASQASGSWILLPYRRQQRGIHGCFLAVRSYPQCLEIPAIGAVEPGCQLQKDVARLLDSHAGERERDLAPHGARCIRRQPPRLGQHRRLCLAQGPERRETNLWIRIAEQELDFAQPRWSKRGQQPDRPRAVEGIAVCEDCLHRGHRTGSHGLEPLEGHAAHVDGRTEQALNLASQGREVERSWWESLSSGRDSIDPAIALAVAHLMPADDRIEPVGHVDRPVRAHGDIARPEPLASILIDLVPDVVRVRRGKARQELEALERESCALRLHVKAEHHIPARIRAQQEAAVPWPEGIALVAGNPGRRAGAGVVSRREDAGVSLVPVRGERVLPGAAIRLPEARAVGTEIPGVRAFHQPRHPAGHHLVVVVVLPEIAERVDRQLVRVPEVVREDSEAGSVRLPAAIAHHSSLVLQVVGRASGVETARTKRPAGSIGHDVRPGIAGIEVPAAVRPGHQRMEPVNPRADDRETERGAQVLVLDEDLAAIRAAVVVGVREDHDSIAGRVGERVALCVVEPAVVDGLGPPDPPSRIHVDVGGVEEHRGFSPKTDLEILGQGELVAQLLAGRLGADREQREGQDDQAAPGTHGGEYSFRRSAVRTSPNRPTCSFENRHGRSDCRGTNKRAKSSGVPWLVRRVS